MYDDSALLAPERLAERDREEQQRTRALARRFVLRRALSSDDSAMLLDALGLDGAA